jgi:hypothetical protein
MALFGAAAGGQGAGRDGQVDVDGVTLVMVAGRACKSCLEIRKAFLTGLAPATGVAAPTARPDLPDLSGRTWQGGINILSQRG